MSNDNSNVAANSSHKKRMKVPKRGPGVAELEKMMREQEGIYTIDKRISELTDGNQYDSNHFSSKNLYSESNPFWSYFGTILKRNSEYSPLKKMVSMTQSHSSTLESANFVPFATAEVTSPPLHLFPLQPCQVIEGKLNSYQQHAEESGLYRRPFYNFLEVEDTNSGGCEAGKVGIDLNLKL